MNQNQRTLKINKVPVSPDNPYVTVNVNAIDTALSDLSSIAFVFYLYLVKNQHNYEFTLSQSDVIAQTNLSRSSYYRGFNELVEKGYIVETSDSKQENNHIGKYIFHDVPVQKS